MCCFTVKRSIRCKSNEQEQKSILQTRLLTLGKSHLFNITKFSKDLFHHSLCFHRKKEMGFNRGFHVWSMMWFQKDPEPWRWWLQCGRVRHRWTSRSRPTSPDPQTQHQPGTKPATHLFQIRHSATAISAGTEGGFYILLHQSQVVACSQLVLQKQGGAHTAQPPMGNDGNPVPQDVRFIHVVCGENNGAACQVETHVGRWELSVLNDHRGWNYRNICWGKYGRKPWMPMWPWPLR